MGGNAQVWGVRECGLRIPRKGSAMEPRGRGGEMGEDSRNVAERCWGGGGGKRGGPEKQIGWGGGGGGLFGDTQEGGQK